MMQEQVLDGAGEFRVIAPSTRTTRTILAVLAFFTAVGAFMTLTTAARAGWTMAAARALGTGLTFFLLGILFFTFIWLWSANVRLLIGHGAVGYRNIFRRSDFWYLGQVDRVVDMAISYAGTSQPQRAIYLFGLDGKRLLVLSSRAWQAQDLKDFVDATGVQLDFREAPIKAKDARREFPKAIGWAGQHVYVTTGITMVAAVGLVVGGYALLPALAHK
jgi:hypothetical protein